MKKDEYEKMFALEDSHFWFIGKRYYADSYLKNLKKINKILDVGAGTGGMTKFLGKYGHVTGIENNAYALKLARKRKVRIIKGDAEKLPFKNGSFDLVTIFDVLYHKKIVNVERAIRESARVISPGGYILLTDSAFGFLRGRHYEAVEEKRRFTIGELTQILTRHGIDPIKSSYVYFSILPVVFIKRKIIDRFYTQTGSDVAKPPAAVNIFLSSLLKMESLLLRYLSMPIGSSLIILGQKNR